ncbi:hypothetical protein [Thermoflavimicrobium daqui]|uniref:Uncharacterized protein n=1 Tax=Thermoflavimicrobium daqui TaxID=2137476 RepID=A0A364K172_9BACL|nr:hypothetical protein [Thermoflavimicrobium daqui]RAL21323.1 hypothetical protein DL897_16935 [Thermoflavimicrobium daqui]
MSHLQSYLQELQESLQEFKISGNHKQNVERADIFLGFKDEQDDAPGLIINYTYPDHVSLSSRIYSLDPSIIDKYIPTENDFINYSFYLEDLSLDTCFAFVLLFLRSKKLPLDQLPTKWLNYINHWEQEETRSTGLPFHSWGCLHNALGHAYISYQQVGQEIVTNDTKFKKGFIQCLRFIISVLLADELDPSNLTEVDCEAYQKAMTFLRFEEQKYLQLLKHSITVQLELPVKDSDLKVLVDALITTEKVDFKGVLKHFARTDTQNSWTQNGFGLLAVYKPESGRNISDFMISVDPHLNVHLKDLQMKLEQLEQEARQKYRIDIEDAVPAWQDEIGNSTLISSPKDPPTFLTWKQVVHTIWELYCPARSIKVRGYRHDDTFGHLCTMDQCLPLFTDPNIRKHLTIAKWDAQYNYSTIVFSPTMKKFIAACAANPFDFPKLEDLPNESDFDMIELSGGVAVIHKQGIMLLDDWNIELDDWVIEVMDFSRYVDEYQSLLQQFINTRKIINRITKQIDSLYQDFSSGNSPSRKELDKLNLQTTKQKIEIRKAILESITTNPDPNLKTFREKVEQHWGMVSELEKLYETVVETEKILNNFAEARTNSLIQFITLYGFPMVLFAGFFEFVFGDFAQTFPGGIFLGVHFGGLALFLLLSLIGVWILDRIVKRRPPFQTKSKKKKSTSRPTLNKKQDINNRSLPF